MIIQFFRSTVTQFLKIVAPVLCFSMIFFLGTIFSYPIFFEKIVVLFSSQPVLLSIIVLKLFFLIFIISFFFFFVFCNCALIFRFLAIAVFFILVVLRLLVFYPNIAENWIIFQQYPQIFDGIQKIFDTTVSKKWLDWTPFLFIAIMLVVNIISYSHKIIQHNRLFNASHIQKYLDIYEKFYTKSVQQGLFLFSSLCVGSFFLFLLIPNLNLSLPSYINKQNRPHIFMFVIDSFRYDRLLENDFITVMPFLTQYSKSAKVFLPMLASHANTIKSWEDITTATINLKPQPPFMSSNYRKKSSLEYPLFKIMKEEGYQTLFVSDFLSVKNITEKKMISRFPSLLALLIFPKWQKIMPNFFEIPFPEDPRILARTFANVLTNHSHHNKPLFITTFFSLDTIELEGNPDHHIQNIYHQSLRSIDQTLEILFSELKKKEWDKNSIVLVFGTHGQSLTDNGASETSALKLGNEYDFLTPFLMFGDCAIKSHNDNSLKSHNDNSLKLQNHKIMRTIDVAPTIFDEVLISKNIDSFDGVSVFSKKHVSQSIGADLHYMETSSSNLKERALINNQFKLIFTSTHAGVKYNLFERDDIFSENELLIRDPKKYDAIVAQMTQQMNSFLSIKNIEFVQNQKNTFFYSENFNL